MKEKQNNLFTIILISAVILVVAVADLLSRFGVLKLHPADQTRQPSQKTEFSALKLLDKSFYAEVEQDVNEAFVSREKWSSIKRYINILSGLRKINGVYLGRRNTFMECHLPEDYPEKTIVESLAWLQKMTSQHQALVMLVPTADAIRAEDLPLYADAFDQKAYLERVRECTERNYVDLYAMLEEHKSEEIYFRTDPHWTALAAGYAYDLWWERSGKIYRYLYRMDDMLCVTKNFVGEYAERTGLSMKSEELDILRETLKKHVTVCYDSDEIKEGYYRMDKLTGTDPYGYYLGSGFSRALIDTGYSRRKSLLVLGDSYANVFLPLLAPHYSSILFINSEEYTGDYEELLPEEDAEIEVLILQSVPGFLGHFGR